MSFPRMVALFVGHGSPMNMVEKNRYTEEWQKAGESLPRPRAILAISAHWYTEGTAVTAMGNPRTIYDFNRERWPKALFQLSYPAPGSIELAKQVAELLSPVPVQMDQEWGYDHGTWSVLINMYPKADIPVVQLSIDLTKPPTWHFLIGRKLAPLRDQGVMIVASGNVVHNLKMVRLDGGEDIYPWARSFNKYVRDNLDAQVEAENHPLVNFEQHEGAELSVPTPEHYLPLLYVLGARNPGETVNILTDGLEDGGAVGMLSVQIG